MYVIERFLQDSNSQVYTSPAGDPECASPSGPGCGCGICPGTCALPQAPTLMVEMFTLKQLLKIIIHIISRLSLHLSDFSVCLFIYLLDVVYGGTSQLLLIHSPQILVVYNKQ